MSLDRLADNLAAVRSRIAEAARRSGRVAGDVTLVAVTKRRSIEATRRLVELGADRLGENYPQELWTKANALPGLDVHWHLIGHLQSNKARRTAATVELMHGVDSPKLLRVLDALSSCPPVCLQVNASGEASKHGWSPGTILADAEVIVACRNVPVVGLMTMAAEGGDPRPAFALLRRLRDALRSATGLPLPNLSMGMSGDFEVAIEEGATLVRVGSALFEGVES